MAWKLVTTESSRTTVELIGFYLGENPFSYPRGRGDASCR